MDADQLEFIEKLKRLALQTQDAIRIIECGAPMRACKKPNQSYGKGGFAIGDFVVRDRFPDGIPNGVEVVL